MPLRAFSYMLYCLCILPCSLVAVGVAPSTHTTKPAPSLIAFGKEFLPVPVLVPNLKHLSGTTWCPVFPRGLHVSGEYGLKIHGSSKFLSLVLC